MGGYLLQAFIYLCAAVIAVPVAKRLGLGSVLGYLIAGIAIGPVLGLVGSETQEIQHFAEFGVVMMLFLVGLELEPQALWRMRNRLLGLGGLQVVVSTALISGAALALSLYWSVALAVGLIFALSSTAIVLQTLSEKGLTRTEGGRASFSVLLFQDIAVIPMLALIPLLALPELAGSSAHDAAGGHHGPSWVDGLPGWAYALVVLGSVAAVVLGGHFLSRPLFRFIASSRLREIFTAAALLLVINALWVTQPGWFGLAGTGAAVNAWVDLVLGSGLQYEHGVTPATVDDMTGVTVTADQDHQGNPVNGCTISISEMTAGARARIEGRPQAVTRHEAGRKPKTMAAAMASDSRTTSAAVIAVCASSARASSISG